MKTNINSLKPNLLRVLFMILLFCVIGVNMPPLAGELLRVYDSRKITSYNLVGYKFSGLEEYLTDEAVVGYYTNENIKEKDPQKMFTHAQYILAPTVLDFGNLNHRYIIFACSSQEEAFKKMAELDLQPLIMNQYNIVLAKQKNL